MNNYKLSHKAEQDLEDIWVYIAQQNQIAADKQIAQILNRLPMLAQFPDMGKTYYYQWYQSGAKGTPSCTDKSRIYDFAGTSIEHIYPQKADSKDESLEPLINTLGNLTILDPAQNSIASNDAFEAKKGLFQKSSVELTRNIGQNRTWTEEEIKNNKNMLIDIALKVFYP